MPVYKYTIINKQGKKQTNTYKANSEKEVASMLREKHNIILKIEKTKTEKSISFSKKISSKDLAVFCRQFQAMLKAGVPIINCLDIIIQQTTNKKFREIISDIYESLQKGFTLSEASSKYSNVFPSLFISMVEAGEASGNLDDIMDRLAIHFEKEFKINNKIKSAMTYPIVIAVVATAVVIFLLTSVMPTFLSMFQNSGIELPAITKALLSFSNFIKYQWYVIIIIIVLIPIIFKILLKNAANRLIFDKIKLKIPVVKYLNLKVATSRFTRTLSTLLSSGVPLINSLEIVAKVTGNEYIGKVILDSKEEVKKGVSLSDPLRRYNIFQPMVISMIKIGEDSGSLDEILSVTANFYDEEVDTAVNKLTTVVEPIMLVIMAVIVGFIVVGMVLPMFDMFNVVT